MVPQMKIKQHHVLALILAIFSIATAAFSPGEDVETRYGLLKGGIDPDSQRPDHLLWRGDIVVHEPLGYVVVEKVFEMDGYDVALVATSGGGSRSVSSYQFLIIEPDASIKIVQDDELKSDDGTFEVSRSKNTIQIDFGFSGGLTRSAKLVDKELFVSSEKLSGSVPLDPKECDALYSGLKYDCAENPQSKCAKGTKNFSNFSRGWLKAANQKPGFDKDGYEQLCVATCRQGLRISQPEFRSKFCGT